MNFGNAVKPLVIAGPFVAGVIAARDHGSMWGLIVFVLVAVGLGAIFALDHWQHRHDQQPPT